MLQRISRFKIASFFLALGLMVSTSLAQDGLDGGSRSVDSASALAGMKHVGHVVMGVDGRMKVVMKKSTVGSFENSGITDTQNPIDSLADQTRGVFDDNLGYEDPDDFEGGLGFESRGENEADVSAATTRLGYVQRGANGGLEVVIPLDMLIGQTIEADDALSSGSRRWGVKNTPLDPVTWVGGGGGKPSDRGSSLGISARDQFTGPAKKQSHSSQQMQNRGYRSHNNLNVNSSGKIYINGKYSGQAQRKYNSSTGQHYWSGRGPNGATIIRQGNGSTWAR